MAKSLRSLQNRLIELIEKNRSCPLEKSNFEES